MKKIDQSIWVFQLPSGLEVRLVNVPQEDLDFLGGIDRLRQRVQELEKERDHWKNNHETEVRRARILKERTDMPIESVQAYDKWCEDQARIDKLTAERDELLAALEMIAGKRYCLDALMSNSDIAKAAIASVKEKQNAAD